MVPKSRNYVQFMPRIRQSGISLIITIPKHILEELGLKIGDYVHVAIIPIEEIKVVMEKEEKQVIVLKTSKKRKEIVKQKKKWWGRHPNHWTTKLTSSIAICMAIDQVRESGDKPTVERVAESANRISRLKTPYIEHLGRLIKVERYFKSLKDGTLVPTSKMLEKYVKYKTEFQAELKMIGLLFPSFFTVIESG